jgi:hypothetical protein
MMIVILGILANIAFGAYYGAMIAVSIAVLRYARHTRHEGMVRTSEDQYPIIRAWCLCLMVLLTIVMWMWPFQYFTFIWRILQLGNMEYVLASLLIALVKPLAALVTAFIGVRLYERSRSAYNPEREGFRA